MVEKIIVQAEEVRGLGNILMPKSGADYSVYNCTLEVGEDSVWNEDMTVYIMTPADTDISLVLSATDDSYLVGEGAVLSCTVLEDGVPVTGQSVSFRCNGAEFTTGNTGNNGVATAVYTVGVGDSSLNFSAIYAGHTSNTVSVLIEHDYGLSFSQSSYVAVNGFATLEMTLEDNSVAVGGATISVTGSDSSVYTGTTNSQGVASVTVSNISSLTTFTASYQNVTATCTVNVSSYIFYDECSSADGLSQYGSVRPISSSTTTSQLEYNSGQNAYLVHANGDWGIIPITALNGLDNYKITGEFKTRSSSNASQGGIGFIAQNGTNNLIFRKYSTSCNSVINDSSQQNIGTIRQAYTYWHKFEITKQGRNYTVTVTDIDTGTVIGTQTRTITFDTYYVGFMVVGGTNYGSYVRNVKAETL